MCVSSCRASRPRSLTAPSVTHDPLASGDLIAERRFAYAKAAAEEGDFEAAAQAFRETLVADPADAQGAMARLALIGRGDAPRALPLAYVARLFDDYAPRFDKHLTKNLHYRAPPVSAGALSGVAPGPGFASVFALGSGPASWARRCAT